MKIDNGYFKNIEPVIDLDRFVELLLVTLAVSEPHISDICLVNEPIIRTAKLSPNYKKQIEEIMYDEDLFSIEFLQLIDHYQYYERQSKWELSLAESFNNYLKNNNKFHYNFEFDYIEVKFDEVEIHEILKKYDEKTKEIMRKLTSYIYNSGLERYHELTRKEAEKSTKRKYIRNSATTFSNIWTNIPKKEDKTVQITVNSQYIKK